MKQLDQLPSFTEHRIDFPVREGYILTNASVTTHNGKIVALVHATDHWMDDRGIWLPYPPGSPESRCRFADNLIYFVTFADDFTVESVTEVTNDRLDPSPPWPFRGFEGGRLFSWRGDLWAGLATSGITPCPGDEFYMGRLAPAVRDVYTNPGLTFVDLKRLAAYGGGKNWMPNVYDDELRFHYWPGTLINPETGERGRTYVNPYSALHGGSQVIPYRGGGLAVVHAYDDVPGTFRRATRQYFIRFDAAGRPLSTAQFSVHPTAQLEITTGMAYHPNPRHPERLMISYGRDEADEMIPRQERAFIATIDPEEVVRLL